MGCSIFLPWCVYYFSSHQHRKCTFFSWRQGGSVVLSVQVRRKHFCLVFFGF
ncbi:hypothetical protein TSAR_001769 [Trichomalopsis sarcophagae]|uniref:Uncharacterized protein n=1 Tax=Trichomalopsis sarcophagae TaxID=543379 RepID=A0A232EFI9_9HYME|nr:hypothetical protein TSAR_001769 [Trichomalopsis sarcophagae]